MGRAQARFVLSEEHPIRLYPLGVASIAGGPVATVSDFCYSVEVAGPKGVSCQLAHAFGDFVCAHRLLSTEEVVFERITRGGYLVHQSPELVLTPRQRERALELALKRSHSAGMQQPYYPLTKRLGALNCTSHVFVVLDDVLAERYSLVQRIVSKLLWRLPIQLRSYLRLRSAIEAGVQMPTLNEEFEALAASAELTARLRQQSSSSSRTFAAPC